MQSKLIEAVSDEGNWGKFLVGKLGHEWEQRSAVDGLPLVRARGWGLRHLWVLDLQTGEGAFFLHDGLASSDLNRHKIWVCPRFEPFLTWLYEQDCTDLEALPKVVEISGVPVQVYGYRRPGYGELERMLAPGTMATLENGVVLRRPEKETIVAERQRVEDITKLTTGQVILVNQENSGRTATMTVMAPYGQGEQHPYGRFAVQGDGVLCRVHAHGDRPAYDNLLTLTQADSSVIYLID